MDISIGKLTITNFCEDNIEHIKFREDLVNDEVFHKFFPYENIESLLRPVTNDGSIEVKNTYIVKDKEKLIGWLYLGGIEHIVSLDCAVHPNYRNLGYGTMIVEECSNYLFQNNIASEIEVTIRKDNNYSISCIEKCNYKRLRKMDDFYIYKSYNRGYK